MHFTEFLFQTKVPKHFKSSCLISCLFPYHNMKIPWHLMEDSFHFWPLKRGCLVWGVFTHCLSPNESTPPLYKCKKWTIYNNLWLFKKYSDVISFPRGFEIFPIACYKNYPHNTAVSLFIQNFRMDFFFKPKQHMGRGVLLPNRHGLHDVSINTRKSGPVQPLFSVGSPPAGPGHLLTVHPPSSWIPKSLISNYLIFGFTSFSSVSSSLSSTCWMTKSLEPSSTISTSDLLSSP